MGEMTICWSLMACLVAVYSITSSVAIDVGLSPLCHLDERHSLTTVLNTKMTRYDVLCLGWRFYGGVVTVETDSSGIVSNGVSIEPAVLATFVPPTNASSSVLENDAFIIVSQLFGIDSASFAQYATNQVIAKVWYYDGTNVVLSYYVLFSYNPTPGEHGSQPTAIVDVQTGQVLENWDSMNSVGQTYVPGIGGNNGYGYTLYYPWVYDFGTTICTDYLPYYQINDYRGTTSVVAQPYCPASTEIVTIPPNVQYVNNAIFYSPLVMASYIAKHTYDMFKSLVGVSFNGASTSLVKININYGLSDNAGTNPSTSEVFVGAGASRFYPLATCTDVVSHELAHLHIARYSSLSTSGQGGAIAEAYCDMAAEAVQQYTTGSSDYLFATKCLKDTTKAAARWLCTPELDGGIVSASQWTPGMNIYTASGVYRKAFCLAAQCSTASIGVLNAFKTFAYANMVYWSPTATFATAACGVKKAAALVFTQSAQINCFVNAFSQVGITVPSTCV